MEKALFCNNLIKKITAALMIVMLLIPYCFAQVTFGDNKSDLKNAQNQQNDIQNKKKETEDKIAQLKAQSSDLTSLIQGLDAQMGELSASLDDINTQIATLEAEIEETQAQLEQAEADKESRYEAMKLRIQFMYEHNDYTYVEVLVEWSSILSSTHPSVCHNLSILIRYQSMTDRCLRNISQRLILYHLLK